MAIDASGKRPNKIKLEDGWVKQHAAGVVQCNQWQCTSQVQTPGMAAVAVWGSAGGPCRYLCFVVAVAGSDETLDPTHILARSPTQ